MVSSCFIHRVPGIVYMGILSNGGAGSILLLGLLTGNEAVSGSKVGTPLIVVSIILLLSITAGGMDWSPSWEQPNWSSPQDVRAALIRTVSRFHGCPNDVVIENLFTLPVPRWEEVKHCFTLDLNKSRKSCLQPFSFRLRDGDLCKQIVNNLNRVWRGLQHFVQRWNVPNKIPQTQYIAICWASSLPGRPCFDADFTIEWENLVATAVGDDVCSAWCSHFLRPEHYGCGLTMHLLLNGGYTCT